MYYIAVKGNNDNYILDEVTDDWHKVVDGYEPIDCIDGEIVIYDDQGHNY